MKKLRISYKIYSTFFLVIVLEITLPAALTGSFLEPLSGDLTRIGYYSENYFGWNDEEYEYLPKLSQKGTLEDDYDIVIIGDSFSNHRSMSQTPEGAYWTSSLARETGLRVGVFDLEKYSVDELLEHYKNISTPPKLIIYQTIERALKGRLGKRIACPDKLYLPPPMVVEFEPIDVKPKAYRRKTKVQNLDIGYTLKFIANQLANDYLNDEVVLKKLAGHQLFSNKKSEYLLFYKGDLKKMHWTKSDWQEIKCNALELQNKVQKDGVTLFLFLVAPDKHTIYSNFFLGKKESHSQLNIFEDSALNYLRLDTILIEHARNGEKDLYLPNDTHWSFKAHSLVAKKVVDFMSKYSANPPQ